MSTSEEEKTKKVQADLTLKLLLVGDSGMYCYNNCSFMKTYLFVVHLLGVGKTCMLLRFAADEFSLEMVNTIG